MRKNQIIILALSLAILVMAGVLIQVSLQKQEQEPKPVILEDAIPPGAEEDFYKYLELPSRSGKFLRFSKDNLELVILYLNTETMKVSSQSFKIDAETVFSKAAFEPYQPNIFARKDLEKIKPETITKVFYIMPQEKNEIPLARLVQVEASF